MPAREEDLVRKLQADNAGPYPDSGIRPVWKEIISASLSLEQPMGVAYLGPKATFTHQASRSRFGGSVGYKPCETISDVFLAVENRLADYGVVPIENSTEGAVTHTLDQFTNTPLKICSEIYLPISHNLMANCPKDEVIRVYSNPQVFGQCRRWLHTNLAGVELIPVSSTAKAFSSSFRLLPGRGRSFSAPSRLPSTNLCRVRCTVATPVCNASAISRSLRPSSVSSRIRARFSLRAECLPLLMYCSKTPRSSSVRSTI